MVSLYYEDCTHNKDNRSWSQSMITILIVWTVTHNKDFIMVAIFIIRTATHNKDCYHDYSPCMRTDIISSLMCYSPLKS